MRILLSGGGTAGHVNPALAIARIIERNDKCGVIAYVGTPHGIENKLVPEKYQMFHINVQGVRRSLSLANLKTVFLALTSVNKAKKIIEEFKPDVVIGTGGYVCWPLVHAAHKMGVPVVMHESNSEPGMVVRLMEEKADVIFVNFDDSIKHLDKAKKVVHVGTPLRDEFYLQNKQMAREKLGIAPDEKFVLSFGGSLGARKINEEMIDVMNTYGKHNPKIRFLHATGSRSYECIKLKFDNLGLSAYENLTLTEYIYDMPMQMAAADLVVCRSGASTLSELAMLGTPSILIPSPNVTNDQQYKNAKVLADAGAASVIPESQLTHGILALHLKKIIEDDSLLESMSEKLKTFIIPNSDKTIYKEIVSLACKCKEQS